MSKWVSITTNDFLYQCRCGSIPAIYRFFIHGIANHVNYLVSCVCGNRTRNRRTIAGAVEDWNEEQFLQTPEADDEQP